MQSRFLIIHLAFFLSFNLCQAQDFVRTSDLFRRSDDNSRSGRLNIIQDQAIDTLISRYILYNKHLRGVDGNIGMNGWRIQIYSSSSRDAREESAKV